MLSKQPWGSTPGGGFVFQNTGELTSLRKAGGSDARVPSASRLLCAGFQGSLAPFTVDNLRVRATGLHYPPGLLCACELTDRALVPW